MLSFLGHDEIENLGFPMKLLGGGFISHLRSTHQNEKLPQFSDIEFKKFIQTQDRPYMFKISIRKINEMQFTKVFST